MSVPHIIFDLVERFERNYATYKSGSYNETQVRREFIDPFFEALGWDVNNIQGYAEAYKDVIHEDAVKVGGITKAPDYSFRIGGTRKFFVEAKKPSIQIKDDPAPAFQVRRYAWSAKLPLSIVTDFEELAVYDCRVKPDQKDKADKTRVAYYTFRQYVDKWDEIAAIFSRDAILKGSFDKYAESHKAKRGTSEVDSAFLEEIESWRDTLARIIALRNTLGVRELNEAVQRTIDRIIFLRIAEDRGIEEYGTLRSICNGPNTFSRLRELFYKADDRYNSGLFHFRHEKGEAEPPDNLTISLVIDDKPLKEILKRLYYPDSPYEFAVLPADILGQVYEQFLGKVIRLTGDHRAVVEDKPEVKKAGGVFYTPTYIVEYIVKNTVGKLLNSNRPSLPCHGGIKNSTSAPPLTRGGGGGVGLTPAEASKLRILDPSCGSGSFLLGAYQYLLDWHLNWYAENDPEKWAKQKEPRICAVGAIPCVRPTLGGDDSRGDHKDAPLQVNWRLTTAERKKILLNNIYGVDIDSQAVEVTKLSLLLKVLEGETGETLQQQMRLFHERALPDLGDNIKCGNSLIGPDFHDGRQMGLMDNEEMYRVNVFDWEREFAHVFNSSPFKGEAGRGMGSGGGKNKTHPHPNPLEREGTRKGGFDAVIGNPPYGAKLTPDDVQYLKGKYHTSEYQLDTYPLFIEKSHLIVKSSGYIGLIVPSAWVASNYDKSLRKLVASCTTITAIIIAPKNTFINATVETLILVAQNTHIDNSSFTVERWDSPELTTYCLQQNCIVENNDYVIPVYSNSNTNTMITKIRNENPVLSNYVDAVWGVKIYQKGKGKPQQNGSESVSKVFHSTEKTKISHKPLVGGKDIKRFRISWQGTYVDYGTWLAEPRTPEWFVGPRILVREITANGIIQATIVEDEYVFSNSVDGVRLKNEYLKLTFILGIINSKFISFFHSKTSANAFKGAFPKVLIKDILNLPAPQIDFTNPADKTRHDRMVQLVEQMLDLHKQLSNAKTGHEQTHLQRQIDATDQQIDRLVYELYGLTDEEIAVVEGR
jgi:predicted type IV restriction endonuclease